ncbi:uncharacterized protein G2W53_025980 [Senna tora]|uniref:Uncharacterized protein n=1 Tax=Senna tora TaxID=362788 RepID=A0A834TGS2_9FABA|nr:uncharacterized protein G2W53_025980 [Senna tora]
MYKDLRNPRFRKQLLALQPKVKDFSLFPSYFCQPDGPTLDPKVRVYARRKRKTDGIQGSNVNRQNNQLWHTVKHLFLVFYHSGIRAGWLGQGMVSTRMKSGLDGVEKDIIEVRGDMGNIRREMGLVTEYVQELRDTLLEILGREMKMKSNQKGITKMGPNNEAGSSGIVVEKEK